MRKAFIVIALRASPGAIGGTVSEDRSRAGGRGVRGSVKFFETYPGPYVPRPIEFTVHQAETGLRQLAAAEKVSQALFRRTALPMNASDSSGPIGETEGCFVEARTRRLERVDATSDAALFVFVRLHSGLGNEDKVRAALTMVVTASRAEPGCVSIHAFGSGRDPQLFFIHSVWKDADALDRHAKLPHTVEFMETVDGLLDEPREVTRTRRIA